MKNNGASFRVAMLIKELHSKTTHIISDNLRESGLTHQQTMIIKLIAHNKQMTISQICKEMSLAKGTVSGIVQRLEKMGYLVKEKHEEDMRNTYIRFSEKGLEFSKSFRGNINNSFENVFKNCSEEELNEMIGSLRNMLDKIDAN